MPIDLGTARNFVYVVAGATGSGKSNYIAVLVNVMKEHSKALRLRLEIADEGTSRTVNENANLFRERELKEKTDRARELPWPMLFRIATRRGYALVSVFDLAGEDLNAEEDMDEWHLCLLRADGIVFMIDPLQVDRVAREVGPSAEAVDQGVVFDRVIRFIRAAGELDGDGKISIPLALVCSKFDAVCNLDSVKKSMGWKTGREFENRADDWNRNPYWLSDDEVDLSGQRMSSIFEKWRIGGIFDADDAFNNAAYFPASALGPEGDQLEQEPKPIGVAEPFLWLLAQSGLEPVRERARWIRRARLFVIGGLLALVASGLMQYMGITERPVEAANDTAIPEPEAAPRSVGSSSGTGRQGDEGDVSRPGASVADTGVGEESGLPAEPGASPGGQAGNEGDVSRPGVSVVDPGVGGESGLPAEPGASPGGQAGNEGDVSRPGVSVVDPGVGGESGLPAEPAAPPAGEGGNEGDVEVPEPVAFALHLEGKDEFIAKSKARLHKRCPRKVRTEPCIEIEFELSQKSYVFLLAETEGRIGARLCTEKRQRRSAKYQFFSPAELGSDAIRSVALLAVPGDEGRRVKEHLQLDGLCSPSGVSKKDQPTVDWASSLSTIVNDTPDAYHYHRIDLP